MRSRAWFAVLVTACGSATPSAPHIAAGDAGAGGIMDVAGAPSLASAGAGAATGTAGSGSAGAGPAGASGLGDGGREDAGSGGEVETSCADLLSGMPASKWVFADAAGTLHYQPLDARGDRIVDFSYAGYRGGGVAFPEIKASSELSPSGGDDTARIQAAIDAVSQRVPSASVRGAVALGAGTFKVSGTLRFGPAGSCCAARARRRAALQSTWPARRTCFSACWARALG